MTVWCITPSFSLEPTQAVEMDPGLMAVIVYWTEMANHLDEPMMQMQLLTALLNKFDKQWHFFGNNESH